MKSIIRGTIWVALLALIFLPAAYAQQQGQQQQPPKPPVQPGQPAPPAQQPGQPGQQPPPPETPPVNPEEEAAYKAFFEAPRDDMQTQIKLGEEFVQKFPESRYRESVYSKLASAYFMTQQLDKVVLNSEKALELNPDHVDVLALLAYVLPRRYNPNALDAQQQLQKAEKVSRHALELLETMVKPATLTDEDFARAKNEKLAMCHSGLGLSYLHMQRYADALTSLEKATQESGSPDPTDFYLLGLLYKQTKRVNDSVTAFTRCSEMVWPWQDRCKQYLEQAKKDAATQPAPPKP